MAPFSVEKGFPTAIISANTILITLAAATTCMRLWARSLRKISFQANDYIICLSWLFNFGLAICINFAVTRGGVGQHQHEVSSTELKFSLKMFLPFGVLGSLAVSAVKISALDLFNHIFPSKKFQMISYLAMGLISSYGIAFAITSMAACEPFAFNWDKELVNGTCIQTSKFYMAQTILGVVFDVIVVALPMPMLWRLQMRVQRKIALSGIFGVGILICIISAVRAFFNSDTGLQKSDFTYYAGIAVILAAFENNLSIICASLPVVNPAMGNLMRVVKSTFSRSSISSVAGKLSGWSSREQHGPGFSNSLSRGAKSDRSHDHAYPLALLSFEGTTTQNTVEGPGSGEVVSEIDDLQQDETQPHSAIAVTKAWNVSSRPSV